MSDTVADDSLAPQEPRPARTRRRKVVPALIALVMVGAVVGLVWNLASGSLFFYNADEAVERRDELGGRRRLLHRVRVLLLLHRPAWLHRPVWLHRPCGGCGRPLPKP